MADEHLTVVLRLHGRFQQSCLLEKNILCVMMRRGMMAGGNPYIKEQKCYPCSRDKFVMLSSVSGQLVLI